MTKRIGFVILTWNSEKVIAPCLEAVFGLEKYTAHAVVVNNGSTDRTEEKINAVRVPEKNTLTVLRLAANRGTTVPRNMALRQLQRQDLDYICILDSDTVINEAAVDGLIAALESNERYGVAGPRMVTSAGVVQQSARRFPTLTDKLCKAVPLPVFQRWGERLEEMNARPDALGNYEVDYLMSACWMLKPDVLRRAGLLDEKIFYAPEDAEYCIRVWKNGFSVVYCPSVTIIHEWQRLSRKKFFSRINWEHIKGLLYMFCKHGYLFDPCKPRAADKEKNGKLRQQ